ncbi:hypothetical protein Cri9333_4849 (plasmid) [Crinalium epipsammum PCC 9333]|uniref:Ubiquitin-like domain-containing protein n=1 Tax=Crinalium epipsammum PCC 9333 TaxID=1173022 RepID=K9W836_9CYAN|nr:hypothetical protein [Crinalium epipsammum]AFZ15615.1 hypothetical protein Cri9333_4849 [Crinalium epipsammum PCC 9333]
METIKVTVRTVDGNFKKTTDVPGDMLIEDFQEQAQELANLSSVPCHLLLSLDKTTKILQGNDTFQGAGIQPGSLLTLTPNAEGGY